MGKKQKCPEFENHERWLVSFADMMTLLFALFVVLYALKEGSDDAEISQAAQAVAETFSVMTEIPSDRRSAPSEAGVGIFEYFRGNQRHPGIVQKMPDYRIAYNTKQEMDRVWQELRERLPEETSPGYFDRAPDVPAISVATDTGGYIIRLQSAFLYDPGETRVRGRALAALDVVVQVLKPMLHRLIIECHTSTQPESGALTNWELSGLRATFILRRFVRVHDYPARQLTAGGLADTRPIAGDDSRASVLRNRRVDIRVRHE